MAVQYIKNSGDGVVHVINPAGTGEFTFCDIDSSQEDSGGFENTGPCAGPATCADCQQSIGELRDAIKGVRFRT